MLIREYKESDLDALRRLHAAQGFNYPFPDLSHPLFISKLVLEDDSGAPAMAVLLRLTAETYLLHDPHAGTPRDRWQRFLVMHEATRRDAAARGLDDAQAFLPPPVARAFGRRLERLGWRRDPWPCFTRKVDADRA
jgi:uncharacterized protein involved in type VI secretion and phage assembly